jgi:hypothetical protein
VRIWCIVERSGKPSDPAPVPESAGGRDTTLRAAAVRSSRRGGPRSCLPGDAAAHVDPTFVPAQVDPSFREMGET